MSLPERDFTVNGPGNAGPVPFLDICLPGMAAEAEDEPGPGEDTEIAAPVSDEEARDAVHEPTQEAQESIREPRGREAKRTALDTLKDVDAPSRG